MKSRQKLTRKQPTKKYEKTLNAQKNQKQNSSNYTYVT